MATPPVTDDPVPDLRPLTVHAPPLRGAWMSQRWVDLAFLHWFVPPGDVARFLPPGCRPDVVEEGPYAGRTAVALVPFRMVGAGFGPGPPVPYLGTFWETNVRLYSLDAQGRRGIVFRSLDASRLAVVLGARAALGLPYRWARMRGAERVRDGGRELVWTARTRWPGPSGLQSRVAVRVGERVRGDDEDAPLARFLTARWGLHTSLLGRTVLVRNHHPPWELRRATVLHLDDQLVGGAGFPGLVGREPDHVLFAEGTRTVFGLDADGARLLRRAPG